MKYKNEALLRLVTVIALLVLLNIACMEREVVPSEYRYKIKVGPLYAGFYCKSYKYNESTSTLTIVDCHPGDYSETFKSGVSWSVCER